MSDTPREETEAALEELREIKTQLEVENASLRTLGLDLGEMLTSATKQRKSRCARPS